jgi:hypothetical protein
MNFQKISALTSEDRTKLKNYWSDLWGKEFAKALTTDFETDGKTVDVKANSKESIIKSSKENYKIKKVSL